MKDEGYGLNSNPKYVTEGDKRRALGARRERNADSAGRPQNTYKLQKIFDNILDPSGTTANQCMLTGTNQYKFKFISGKAEARAS